MLYENEVPTNLHYSEFDYNKVPPTAKTIKEENGENSAKHLKFPHNVKKKYMVILIAISMLIIEILLILLFGTIIEQDYRSRLEKGRILVVTGNSSEK